MHDDVTCVVLPDATTFTSSFKFGPKQGILEKQSVEVSLSVARIHVALDALLNLRHALKQKFGHAGRRQDLTSLSSPNITRKCLGVVFSIACVDDILVF